MSDVIENKVSNALEIARGFIVGSQESLTIANTFVVDQTCLLKEIDDHHDPIIKAAHEVHKTALGQKKKLTDPLNKAILIVKTKIAAYLSEQRRIQREQEEKRRRMEEERKKLEDEAIRKAQEAEQLGNNNEAEKILEDAAKEEQSFEPMPIVQEKPEVKGIHLRQNWKFRVTNLALLCRERPDLIIADTVKIGKLVRITKDQTNIPGIEAYCEDNLTVRH